MRTSRALGLVWFAALFSLVGAGTGAAQAQTKEGMQVLLHVELKPQVEVTQSQVVLADIAYLRSSDLTVLRRAMALPLGHAPRPGGVVSLTSERAQQWLRGQTGLGSEQVLWTGAGATEISTASRMMAGEELLSVTRTSLRQHLESMASQSAIPTTRIELQEVSAPPSQSVPIGLTSWRVRPLGNTPIAKRMRVWVDIFTEGRFVRAVPVSYDVSIFASAAVAANALAAGQTLLASQLVEREMDIARMPSGHGGGASMSDIGTTHQTRLRRSVQRGEVITQAHLQEIPAVSRGEWASLTSQSGAIALESRVEVLQDGQVGQIVRVKQANATSTVLARVSGSGRLEMQP